MAPDAAETGTSPDAGMDASDVDSGANACGNVNLSTARTLEFDLKKVTVSGTVTLNGADLPDPPTPPTVDADQRGEVRLSGDGGDVRIGLGATGPETFTISLAPGVYDVSFEPGSNCSSVDPAQLPCVGGEVSVVEIDAGSIVNIDIRTALARGSVTLNGGPLPAGLATYGQLSFFSVRSDTVPIDPSTGEYAINVLPGEHSVTYVPPTAVTCPSNASAPLPCNSGTIAESLLLDGNSTVDIDLVTARVQGAVRINGNPMPDEESERGRLVARRARGSNVTLVEFGLAGPVAYSATLLAGTYDLRFISSISCNLPSGLPTVPCENADIATGLPIGVDQTINVDVPAVTVSGSVTLNGGAFGDTAWFGGLVFTRDGGNKTVQLSGATPTYALRLIAGPRQLVFQPRSDLCGTSPHPELPCVNGPLGPPVDLVADKTLNVDLNPVVVQGTVLLNGAAMPDSTLQRGRLSFGSVLDGLSSSNVYDMSLGTTGPAAYSVRLLPGTYGVSYLPTRVDCVLSEDLPCFVALMGTFSPTADSVVDWNVESVHLSVHLTLNGSPFPDLASERGRFLLFSDDPLWFATPLLGQTGDTFDMILPVGDYSLTYLRDAPQTCDKMTDPLPCGAQRFGCP